MINGNNIQWPTYNYYYLRAYMDFGEMVFLTVRNLLVASVIIFVFLFFLLNEMKHHTR